MHNLNGTAGESVSIASLLRDRRRQAERIAALEADYKQLDVLYGEEFNRNNVLVGERAALRQQLLVAQAEVKRMRDFLEKIRQGDNSPRTCAMLALSIPTDTSAIDSLQRDAESKQAKIDELMFEYCPEDMTAEQIAEYSRHQRPVSDEEAAAIDAAIGASHEQM